MFASRSFSIDCVAIDCVSGLIRIPDGRRLAEEPGVHPVLRSLVPALETAFGIEHEALFPAEIRALVEALRAGPLGAAPADRVLEVA